MDKLPCSGGSLNTDCGLFNSLNQPLGGIPSHLKGKTAVDVLSDEVLAYNNPEHNSFGTRDHECRKMGTAIDGHATSPPSAVRDNSHADGQSQYINSSTNAGMATAFAAAGGGTTNLMFPSNTNCLLFEWENIRIFESHRAVVWNLGVIDDAIIGYQMKACANVYANGFSPIQQYFIPPCVAHQLMAIKDSYNDMSYVNKTSQVAEGIGLLQTLDVVTEYKFHLHIPINASYSDGFRSHYTPWGYVIIDVSKNSGCQLISSNAYFVNPSGNMLNACAATDVFNRFERMFQQQWPFHSFTRDEIIICPNGIHMLSPAEIGYTVLGFIHSISKARPETIHPA